MEVRYILEGSCRKASGRVRLTAQLIEVLNGHHIWAERYCRDLQDIFVIQEELTRRNLAALALKLRQQNSRSQSEFVH